MLYLPMRIWGHSEYDKVLSYLHLTSQEWDAYERAVMDDNLDEVIMKLNLLPQLIEVHTHSFNYDFNPLHMAILNGSIKTLEYLLDRNDVNVNESLVSI